MKFYTDSTQDVLNELQSSDSGLSSAQASERLERYGRNKLRDAKKTSLIKRFFEQLKDPMIIILIIAAIVSAVVSFYEKESFADTMGENAFDHAVMRSMKKDRPFMLMESAPGLVNWHGCNKMKRPGVHRLASLQAVALGSDTVQYFQWRKGRGSFEQYHGAVLDHLGTWDTRIFREVAQVGADLEKLSDIRGTLVKSKVALLFDWDNMWAIDDMRGMSQETKLYPKTCIQMYKNLLRFGVDVDIIPSDDPLDDYEVVVAPMLYMIRPGVGESLKRFVERGGQLLATYLTGYVDENQLNFLGGFPGDGLTELFGE